MTTPPEGGSPVLRHLAEVAHAKAHEIGGRVACPTDDLAWWEQIVAAVLAVGAPAAALGAARRGDAGPPDRGEPTDDEQRRRVNRWLNRADALSRDFTASRIGWREYRESDDALVAEIIAALPPEAWRRSDRGERDRIAAWLMNRDNDDQGCWAGADEGYRNTYRETADDLLGAVLPPARETEDR